MKIFGMIWVCLFGFGCAHSVYIPNTPHQVPVVAKKRWGGQIGMDLSSAASVPLFTDTISNPPVRAQGEVGAVGGAGSSIVAALGIFEPVDIYLTHGLGIRWQFLGIEDQQPWKATVFVGNMGSRTSESGSQSGTVEHKASTRVTGTEYGASVGYQRNESLLFYSTLARRQGQGATEIKQPNAIHQFEDDFSLTTLVFGLQFGQPWYFNAEIGGSSINWKNAPSGDVFASSLGFGYRW